MTHVTMTLHSYPPKRRSTNGPISAGRRWSPSGAVVIGLAGAPALGGCVLNE